MKKRLQNIILDALSRNKTQKKEELYELMISDSKKAFSSKDKYAVNRVLKTLLENDCVAEHESDNKSSFLQLTAKGRNKARSQSLSQDEHTQSMIPKNWDGRWRIVLLSLPESRKEERNALRYILKKAGFVLLKNSVWISPYPFEHFLYNMKKDMSLSDELMIIVSENIDPLSLHTLKSAFAGE